DRGEAERRHDEREGGGDADRLQPEVDEDGEQQRPDERHDAGVDARWVRAAAHAGGNILTKRGPAPREAPVQRVAQPAAVSSTVPPDFPPPPLRASSYGPSALLRPTPAPRWAQWGI